MSCASSMQSDSLPSFYDVYLRYKDTEVCEAHAFCKGDQRDQGGFLCRRRFDSAVVVGFMEKAGDLKINPPEEEGMPEGARVVALADDGMHTHKRIFAMADRETGMAAHTQR